MPIRPVALRKVSISHADLHYAFATCSERFSMDEEADQKSCFTLKEACLY
jgi:hypothetical protein